ncbi:hypothetical protein GCM10023192_20560 [Amycolatopsis samaneae]
MCGDPACLLTFLELHRKVLVVRAATAAIVPAKTIATRVSIRSAGDPGRPICVMPDKTGPVW